MSKGFFTVKTSKSTDSSIINIIGKARNNLDSLSHYVKTELNLKGDFKFMGLIMVGHRDLINPGNQSLQIILTRIVL